MSGPNRFFQYALLFGIIFIWAIPAESIQYNLNSPDTITVINGEKVSMPVFQLIREQFTRGNLAGKKKNVLKYIIDTHLLAEHYRHSISAMDPNLPDNTSIQIETEYLQYAQKVLGISDLARMEKDAQKFMTYRNVSLKDIKALFPPSKEKMLIDTSEFDQSINNGQARRFLLLKYRFPGAAEGSVSLPELYKSQSSQGKIDIITGKPESINTFLNQALTRRYVHFLASEYEKKNPGALSEIKRIIQNRYTARVFLLKMGFTTSFRGSGEVINKRADKISTTRIDAYYREHENQFKQVSEVSARHIRVKDLETADRIYEEAGKIKDFGKMVKKYSIALDKNQHDPGRLPLIRNTHPGKLSFLQKACLFQRQGQVSRPLRTPGGYEIILVDKRTEADRDLRDKAVRREIARRIAEDDLRLELNDLKKELLQKAAIQVNTALLGGKLDAR
jgi:parvulin-like peptidyl-prolyl isomerase